MMNNDVTVSGLEIPMPVPPIASSADTDEVVGEVDASALGDDQVPEGMKVMENGQVQVLTSSAYKRLKDQSHKKGQEAARRELEDQFTKAGFASSRDALAFLAKLRDNNAVSSSDSKKKTDAKAEAAVEPEAKEDRTASLTSAFEQEKAALKLERDQLLLKVRKAEKRRKMLEQRADAHEAEVSLRDVAMSSGIRDVRAAKYAVQLLREEMSGKSEAELKKFDERKFFSDLRTTHPYLYGETVKAATTGISTPAPSSVPKPGQVPPVVQTPKAVKDMSKEEFEAHMRKLGLNPTL